LSGHNIELSCSFAQSIENKVFMLKPIVFELNF
jgi:hypothetical protein